MGRDIFSREERTPRRTSVVDAERKAERLANAKEIFSAVAADYIKAETDESRLRAAINMLDALARGSMALHTMERRGITSFE